MPRAEEGTSLLGADSSHAKETSSNGGGGGGLLSGLTEKRRECVFGIGILILVVLVLVLICSLFVSPSDGSSPEIDPDLPEATFDRKSAAGARISSKVGRGGPSSSAGGVAKKTISEENSSRTAVIERIVKKSADAATYNSKMQAAGDRVDSSAHPEERDIVQGRTINPRFAKAIKQDEFDGVEQSQAFVFRDVLAILGTLALFAAFIPQQAQLLRTKDVSSFSLPAVALLFVGSLCFAIFYYTSHSIPMAALSLWVSANTFVILAMKYRLEGADGMGGDGSALSFFSRGGGGVANGWSDNRSNEVL